MVPFPFFEPATHNLFRSRPNVTPLDVREDNMRIGALRLDVGRRPLPLGAGSVAVAVEPRHVLGGIVPDAHGEDHC